MVTHPNDMLNVKFLNFNESHPTLTTPKPSLFCSRMAPQPPWCSVSLSLPHPGRGESHLSRPDDEAGKRINGKGKKRKRDNSFLIVRVCEYSKGPNREKNSAQA
mmetsp:Transcript_3774/g.8414  ORF Transcript_3774/g.8414 Transcript_3774/m.8414 type:complete len:104 (-) Transcript_3774:34-345(-)